MKMMSYVLMAMLAAGCAAARWEHPERSALQEQQDRYVCEDQIYQEHPDWRQMSGRKKQQLVDECMRSRGYRKG